MILMSIQKVFAISILLSLISPIAWAAQLNTQAEIIHEARKDYVNSDKKLSDTYLKINKAFSSDKEFINLLNQDKERFYKERNSMRDLVLPHSHISYGLNSYEAYSPMYLTDLNNQKINYLKNAMQTYCFYHSDMPSGCKHIDNIFK